MLMKFISIDDAINEIQNLGTGTLLAKIDIKNAFILIPVHSADKHLLRWNGRVDYLLTPAYRSA